MVVLSKISSPIRQAAVFLYQHTCCSGVFASLLVPCQRFLFYFLFDLISFFDFVVSSSATAIDLIRPVWAVDKAVCEMSTDSCQQSDHGERERINQRINQKKTGHKGLRKSGRYIYYSVQHSSVNIQYNTPQTADCLPWCARIVSYSPHLLARLLSTPPHLYLFVLLSVLLVLIIFAMSTVSTSFYRPILFFVGSQWTSSPMYFVSGVIPILSSSAC